MRNSDSYTLHILQSAEDDMRRISDYYKLHYPPAIEIFQKEFIRICSQLAQLPKSYQLVSATIRRAPIIKLHLHIYYSMMGKDVYIINVLSHYIAPASTPATFH